jgi:hypothetical protein
MIKTIQETIYSFSELPENLQEKVIAEFNADFGLFDARNTIYDAGELATIIGINNFKVYYSGFYSQGDGACYTGVYSYNKGSLQNIKAYAPLDTELHTILQQLNRLQRKHGYKVEINIRHDCRYYHANSCNYLFNKDLSQAEERAFIAALKEFMHWIYSRLKSDYEFCTSDEYVKEYIESNDYMFRSNGQIYS